MGNFVKEQHKCEFHVFLVVAWLSCLLENDIAQATLVTTARCSTGYSTIVQYRPGGPWVSLGHSNIDGTSLHFPQRVLPDSVEINVTLP